MENMKRNLLLIPFVVMLVMLVVPAVSAAKLADNMAVEFNGVELSSSTVMATAVGDVVPVKVTFVADQNASDVRVKVHMEGNRDDVSVETDRFDIEDGAIYTKLLALKLPTDSKDLSEDYTLYVEIVNQVDQSEDEFAIKVQRKSYTLDVLSADYTSKVVAGDVVPVSVVVKNTGYDRMDDTYVVASIPALGISTRGYVGDLIPAEDYKDYNDEEDSMYRTVYLKIPESAASGVYEMEVEVYNNDGETATKQLISVGGPTSTTVLASVKNQNLNAGETITYDMIIVNSADDVKVFNFSSVSGDALSVSVPSVITVGPESSQVVSAEVTASSDAELGTYTFSVDVDGEQVTFGANVVGTAVSSSVIALTVILVIIFVVLLVVLILLLTKKEKSIEEVETSYY